MGDLSLRSKIDEFEESLRALPNQLAVEELKLNHFLTDNGLYAREMLIPAGTIVTGKIKKEEYISVLSHGHVTEVTEAGMRTLKAPYTMVSYPGTKRIVWAHELSVWVTIHATKQTTLETIEEDVIASSHEDVPSLLDNLMEELT